MTTFHDQVIIDPVADDASPADRHNLSQAGRDSGGPPDPGVIHAFSAKDGRKLWSYGGSGAGWIHNTIGTSGDIAVVAARNSTELSTGDRAYPITHTHLIGVSPDGKQAWQHGLPTESLSYFLDRNARVFGDTVLTVEPDRNRKFVVAREVTTGAVRWRKDLGDVSLEDAVRVDDVALLGGSSGLVVVDLAAGAATRLFEGLNVGRIAVDDRTVVVQVGSPLLMILDRRCPKPSRRATPRSYHRYRRRYRRMRRHWRTAARAVMASMIRVAAAA